MAADNLFIINEGLEARNVGGKAKFKIRIVSQPVAINLDPAFLAMKPALAMAEHLRQKVLAVTTQAAANTLRARRTELAAFVRGAPWAVKRFSGGRMGGMPPMRSENALNNSGRFVKSIRASQSKETGTWRIDVAANRLNDEDNGGFERVWNRLVHLVPEFGKGIADNVVAEGIRWTTQNMIQVGKATSSKLQMGVARELFKVFENVARIADTLAA